MYRHIIEAPEKDSTIIDNACDDIYARKSSHRLRETNRIPLGVFESGGYTNIGLDDTLIFVGHGSLNSFMDKTVSEFCQMLIRILPNNFHGKIYLNGCQTGWSPLCISSYAENVCQYLSLRSKFPDILIKANKQPTCTSSGDEYEKTPQGKEYYTDRKGNQHLTEKKYYSPSKKRIQAIIDEGEGRYTPIQKNLYGIYETKKNKI